MTKNSDLPPVDDLARPTMALRWLQRWTKTPQTVALSQQVLQHLVQWDSAWVLQQAWVFPSGRVEWRDIPHEATPRPV